MWRSSGRALCREYCSVQEAAARPLTAGASSRGVHSGLAGTLCPGKGRWGREEGGDGDTGRERKKGIAEEIEGDE